MDGKNDLDSKGFLRPPISGHGFNQLPSSSLAKPSESNFLLRPSALTATAEKLRTDKTISNSLPNPFSSVKESTSDSEGKSDASKTETTVSLASKSSEDSSNSETNGHNNVSTEKVKVPSAGSSSGYVFGQNISARVLNVDSDSKSFKDATIEFKDVKSDDGKTESDEERGSKSLVESAQEIQDRNTKPELEEIELITGEEDEITIINQSVKSFVFDKEKSNWVERGRGYVRVNDLTDLSDKSASSLKSRIIMRVQGSLKVIINTFVWSDMMIQMANEKSVRLSAQTDDGVKMFLLVFNSSNDANHFYGAVSGRRQRLANSKDKETASTSTNSTSSSAAKRSLSVDEGHSSQPVSPKKSRINNDKAEENAAANSCQDSSSNSSDSINSPKSENEGNVS